MNRLFNVNSVAFVIFEEDIEKIVKCVFTVD